MTPLDESELQAQLRRRAGDVVPPGVLGGALTSTARTAQVASRPWHRWIGTEPRVRNPGLWPALSLALAVVVVLAAANLVRAPSGTPTPSRSAGTTSTWLLDLAQLEQALERVDQDGTYLGTVIVANVTIAGTFGRLPVAPSIGSPPALVQCSADGLGNPTCPVNYVIRGSNPPISVVGVPPATPCAAGRCPIDVLPGPFALGLHGGHVVQYFSPVRLHDGGAVPWTVDGFIGSTFTDPVVVDGWLSGIQPPPCPFTKAPKSDFECGPASWITAAAFNPETPIASDGSSGFAAPERGIRVDNAAYTMVRSPNQPYESGPPSPPRHGLYLVNRLAIDPSTCFLCSSATAFLAAEVEPVDVAETIASSSATTEQPTNTATQAPVDVSPVDWLMHEADLANAVRATSEIGGAGRVVVSDVAFERAGDCREPIDTNTCFVVVSGSNPPIRLINARSDCPPTFYCAIEVPPLVPQDGPFALRILGDATVSFVGYVQWPASPPDPSSPGWGFDDLRTHLAGLDGAHLADYRLFAVTAWISGAAFEPRCLDAGTDPRFACGRAAWLTGEPAQPNAYPTDGWSLRPPTDSIRLQDDALPITSESRIIIGNEQSQLGTFLIRAVLPAPTCVFCDGPVAELVAWLDPGRGLVTPEATP